MNRLCEIWPSDEAFFSKCYNILYLIISDNNLTSRCSERQSLNHVAHSLNATVSDDWHAETSGVLCYLVHRGPLGPPTRHDWKVENICNMTAMETNQVENRQVRSELGTNIKISMYFTGSWNRDIMGYHLVHGLWLEHVSYVLVDERDPVCAWEAGPHGNPEWGLGRSPWQLGVVSGYLLPLATDSLFFSL